MTIVITKTKLAIAVLAMVLVGATTALAVDDNPFTDVPDSEGADAPFFSAPVEWLWDNGLTTGSPAGSTTFKPFDNVTRGEYATFNLRYHENVVQPALEALQTEVDAIEAAAPTIYHAWVSTGGGSTLKSEGVTTSSDLTGNYTVVFPEDVTECTWQVSHRIQTGISVILDPDVTQEPEFTFGTRTEGIIFPVTTFPTDISVFVTDDTGAPAKASFDITVICP